MFMENEVLSLYRLLTFLKIVREGTEEGDEGEGKFGLTPASADPNEALSKTTRRHRRESLQEGPREHPLLSKSAQFSGVDCHLTPEPAANENAQKQYPQLRLAQQLQNKNRQRQSPSPLMR